VACRPGRGAGCTETGRGGTMTGEREESEPAPLEIKVREVIQALDAVLLTGMRRWRQQYDRMKRGRQRPRATVRVDKQTEDDYYAFFVWCYHLKDWLKNDDTVPPAVRDAIEPFVCGNRFLEVCGDLANGVKHLRRDERMARVDPDAKLSAVQGAFQADAFQNDDRIVVVLEGTCHDVSEVADGCVAAWDNFLRTHGLGAGLRS